MDFPEGSCMKAPRGFRSSLWGLSSLPFLNWPFFIKLNQIFKKEVFNEIVQRNLVVNNFRIFCFASWLRIVGKR